MPRLSFHSARRYTPEQLSALMNAVYADYAVSIHRDAAGFSAMVAAFDIDLGASHVAVREGERIAIALLGVRGQRGWIGGMGVLPAYRGQRTGLKVMQAAIRSARQLGLRSIDLEVLVKNAPALRIYEELGFRRRRTLDAWLRDSDATFPLPPQQAAEPLDVSTCLAAFDELHSVTPPWQRDLPSLQRRKDSPLGLGLTRDGQVTAYVLYRMEGAEIGVLDAAAAPGRRTSTIESVFRTLIRDRSGSALRFVNLPQDDPVSSAMRRIGADIDVKRQQYEMTLDL